MEGVNSFEKGLHRSNTPQMQPEGSYVDALNWIRNDSGRLVNEELEEITQTLTDGTYELLGNCPIQDSFVCFFKQTVGTTSYSEIGIFDNLTKQYTRIFNDSFHSYKLKFTNSIDSVARVIGTISNPSSSDSGDRVVYFVEKDNSIRRFNIDLFLRDRSALSSTSSYTYSSINYDRVEDFDLQLSINLPYGQINVFDNGGSLLSGVYAVVFRYRTSENNKTICGIPTKFYFVNDDPGTSEDADGCPPGTQTSKLIKINVTNTDLNYPYIEPIIITYTGLTNVLTIKSLGIYINRNNNEIIFSDESQYKDNVSIEEITENPVFYESAEFIEQKDNVLILSNLTTKKYDENFQQIANNIDVYCYYEEISINAGNSKFNNINKDPASEGINPFSTDDTYANGIKYTRYYSKNGSNSNTWVPNPNVNNRNYVTSFPYKDNSLDKGFQRGEIYSFSITPIYKDGSTGFSYHIPAKLPTEYITTDNTIFKPSIYTSSVEYPEYLQTQYPNKFGGANNKIRHHKMPDYGENSYKPLVFFKVSQVNNQIIYERKINILRVKFKNVDLSSQADNIQGYIIGYQARNSDANKRIIDSGWARPYVQNGNVFRGNFANGATYIETDNNSGLQPDITKTKAFQYFSPTSSPDYFNRDINTSYSLQLYGMAYDDPFSGPGATVYRKDFGNGGIHFFFDQWDEYSTGSVVRQTNSIINNFSNSYKIPWNLNSLKSKITKVIKVPNVVNSPISVDNKYRVHSCTGYVHIEVNDSILAAMDWNKIMNYQGNSTSYNFWQFDTKWQAAPFFEYVFLRKSNVLYNYYLLFRVLNEFNSQYGRLEQAEYTPKKVIFKNSNNAFSNTEINIEGDVYVSSFAYLYRDWVFSAATADYNANGYPVSTLLNMWYEGDINFHMRHRGPDEMPYYPKSLALDGQDSIIQVPADFWKQSIAYNKQYSAESNIKKNFPKPLFFSDVTNFPNRSVYSKQSIENELLDQYRIFPSLQYHDIPKHRGVITDTFVFNNTFYHHTEYGLWLSFFNPNTTQATSQGSIVLGNAGIFQLPSKLVLDIKGGYMGTLDRSGTNTPFGRVFLDHKQGKIFILTGESPIEISDLGLFSYFREFVNTDDEYSMGYDWANKRLLINNISKGKALSFYPKTNTWTSFHNFSPNAYFTTNGYSYAFKDNSFYNLNNAADTRKNSYITYVENTSPDTFKRFDKIEMNTMSGGAGTTGSPGFVEPDNYVFLDKSFTHIHAWTDRQNTTELPFSYSHDYNTNFLASYETDKVPVNYYRSSFHAELPLDAVVNPYQNIFNPENTNINADFRAHMKGKFLYTKLSYNDSKPLVLNYIKTFFKPSVA